MFVLTPRTDFQELMWNEDKSKITAQLSPGEQLLWFGRPRQGLMFVPFDALMIPASIVQGVVFWFFLNNFFKGAGDWFYWLMFCVFGFAIAYNLLIRFFVDIYRRKRTYYGITNERAIIIEGIFSEEIKSMPKSTLTELSLTIHRNGLGTIKFDSNRDLNESIFNQKSGPPPPSFTQIDKAQQVYTILRGL